MHVPAPLRAAVGLLATAADEARRLPDRALELPMLAVSTALQASVRAQQRYARLTARGDAVLNRGRPTDEPPPWATFDDPLSAEELRRAPSRFDTADPASGDSAAQTARVVGDLIGGDAADADDQAHGAANGAQPTTPAAEPAHDTSGGRHAARTQPRQPPPRKAPPKPVEGPTASESSDAPAGTEPADT